MVFKESERRLGSIALILAGILFSLISLQLAMVQAQPLRPVGANQANEEPVVTDRKAFRQACQRIKCASGTRCALYRGQVACVRQDRQSQSRKRVNPVAVTRSETLEFFRPTGTRAKPCPDGAVYLKSRGVCVRQIAKPANDEPQRSDAAERALRVKRQQPRLGACRSGYEWNAAKQACFIDKTAAMARHCERLGKILVGESCR